MTTRHKLIISCLLGIIAVQFAPALPVEWPSIGVPVGPKRVLIVRETLNSDPSLEGVMVKLRSDAYMAKHTADFLDLNAKTKDGPAPAVVAFLAAHPNVTPPALLIAVPNGRTVYCESLPKPATAEGIIATIKANGGGE